MTIYQLTLFIAFSASCVVVVDGSRWGPMVSTLLCKDCLTKRSILI
jgi:hypothetical protein